MTPYTIHRPSGRHLPLLFDSPHSGRRYPESFRSPAPLLALRQTEDAYVDRLLTGTPEQGATLLLAEIPRVYLDLNRDADDIDAELLAEPWPGPLNPTGKTRRGLGLIRRFAQPGVPVYAEKLSVAEIQARIETIHAPYHRCLQHELAGLRAEFGFAWHIDWHSMKSVGNAMTEDHGQRRADFVLGDLDGTSCDADLTALASETLSGLGYRVAINRPYKGAAIVRRCGRPAEGLHSLQIEINRALYLDEAAVETSAGFDAIAQDIGRLTARLAEAIDGRK
jgi:N-formylglutamate deformylase